MLDFCQDIHLIDPGNLSWLGSWVSSPIVLLLGMIFALVFGMTFPEFNIIMSKKLLQYSVVGLGFGMTL